MGDTSNPRAPQTPPTAASPADSSELSVSEHDEAGSIAGETFVQPGTAGPPEPETAPPAERSSGKSAVLVGAGILIQPADRPG